MYTVKVKKNKEVKKYNCEKGQNLLQLLNSNGYNIPAYCGFLGKCRKCMVKVDGKETLSCEYFIEKNVTVEITDSYGEVDSVNGISVTKTPDGADCLALDIGTTTISLALYNEATKEAVDIKTFDNPQKIYGSDVISRIKNCSVFGAKKMQEVLITAVNGKIKELSDEYNFNKVRLLRVSANSVMTHIFLGEDCTKMGVAPYNMSFKEKQSLRAEALNLNCVERVETKPLLHAFFGGDAISGLSLTAKPQPDKINIFVDFGTNAEIAVITEEKIFCTSASAGPCFEGTNISCGMTAKYGAISEFKINKGITEFKTIGEGAVKGICGTGLIDVVSELLRNFIIDENGTFFENDEFEIYNDISVTQEDIREFQSAKSAVRTAMEVLLEKSGYCLEDIDNFYVSGGFSGSLNVQNAKLTGLIPASVENVKLLYNTSLLGAIRNYNEERVLQKCEYVDLIQDALFQKRFLENMSF